MNVRYTLCAGVAMCALAIPAFAQDPVDADPLLEKPVEDAPFDEDIVVTAVARGQNPLESSITISSIDAESISDLNPRSSADLLRQIPGIRSEASGGEGNANINVRGLPVSTGGARYIQLQEDGLPILEFGDIIFGNADNFLRADRSVGRVEVVRGGSASTFASNAPGGVINFISKTGREDGGTVVGTVGLDFELYRGDFEYGASLGDDVRFHAAGYYRNGEGPRDIGFNGFDGGQIKANITKDFDRGYIRVYGKYLDDQTATFLPQPTLVTGSPGDPDYGSLPGLNPNDDALYSRFITTGVTLDGGNNPVAFDIHDGLEVESAVVGFEAEFEFGDGWIVTERFRYGDNSGGFTSPFPASVGAAADVATSIGGEGATLAFASGPSRGAAITDPSTLGGNGLITSVVLFNTRLNSLDNVTNDVRLSRDFELGGGNLAFTAGFYVSRQDVDTDWLWTSFLQTVEGGGDAVLVDVLDEDGDPITQGGFVGFGATFFGNCCRRSYDVSYDTYAPFGSLTYEIGRLTLDGSIRYDFGEADGSITGSDTGFGIGVTSFDFDGDGDIDPAEAQTSILPLSEPSPVNYDFDYVSYSLGASYLLLDNLSLFARYSDGGRHIADRALFTPAVSVVDGSIPSEEGVIADVEQVEAGVKYRDGPLGLYATGFYAETDENNVEIAPIEVLTTSFEAFGVELEGSYSHGPFSVSAGMTWTDAEIVGSTNPDVIGNTPRRQADFIYQVTGQYESELITGGINLVGTTDSFTQDNNDLQLPGYVQVNAFAAIRPFDDIEVSVNATNLFDAFGFTEAEEGSIPANNIVRARSIAGRTVSASVRFDF